MTTTLFQYSLGVSIPLFIMWVSYRCFIADERDFALSRVMILAIYVATLVLAPVLDMINPMVIEVNPTPGESQGANPAPFDLLYLLSIVWASGAIMVALFTVIEIFRIYLMVYKSEKIIHEDHILYLTNDFHHAPFSFVRSIIINRHDYEEAGVEILAHEEGHINLLHSCDMVLAQIVAILCWYNPAAWLMRSDLKSVHEYQADSYALNIGLDARQYQLLLIKKAAGSKFPSIVNNFNHSKLKKRIAMMNRQADFSEYRKLLYLMPLVAIVAGGFILTTPIVKAAISPRIVVAPAKTSDYDSRLEDMKYFIDGNETTYQDIMEISPSSISSITVTKDKKTTQIYIETKDE